jgi:MFS family permease
VTSGAADHGTFRALRVPNFRRYAAANLVSLTGTWMQRIGQDWLVLQISDGSGVALGVTTALQFGPSLFSPVGGVLADRYPKRRLLMVTQSLMGLLALLLGVLVATDVVVLWHVFVLAAGLGLVAAVDVPIRQSFVPEMVGDALVSNAVGLNSTIFNGARLVGPALAGSLIAAADGDTAPAFLINAASFLVTLLALARMRAGELHPSPPVARGRGQLREGLRYVRAHPDLRLAMAVAFVLGTFGFNFQVTIALMATQEYGLGAAALGLLSTAFAIGSLAGALLSARRSGRPTARFLVGSVLVFGALTVVAGLMPGYAAFAAMLVPTGAAALVFSVASNTYVQLGVDPSMRGRVMALYFTCFLGGTPAGAPLIGWVGERFGAPAALLLGGAVVMAAGLVAAVWLSGRRLDAPAPEDDVPPVDAPSSAGARSA